MGNRMSSLPLAQFCAASAYLGEQHGAGRAAAVSSAFHALCAGDPKPSQLLTPEEAAQIASWLTPGDVVLRDGEMSVVLKYADAKKEEEVVLREGGEIVSVGHIDMGWVVPSIWGGKKLAVVGDIKATDFSSPEGPTSLQMEAYGLGWAEANGCDSYTCGHWNASEGGWDWGPVRDLYSMEIGEIIERVKAAALNVGEEYATGPHCDDCYQRLRCREYLLPVQDPESALAPLAKPGGLTKENAYRVVTVYSAAGKLLEAVKKQLYAYVEREGPIPDGEGKIWAKVVGKHTRFDVKQFAHDHPELHKRYTIETERSMGCRWVKERK